jgi:hypothetical protein
MMTTDRLIVWAEMRRLAIDINFRTGAVRIDRHRFKSADDALRWATNFSNNWGFTAP